MTKEQTAYADTLNLIGTAALDPVAEHVLVDTLGQERRIAAHSAGPCVDCPRPDCYWSVPYGGPTDGEHFADLWDHLAGRHHIDPRQAEDHARVAWRRPVLEVAA